MLKKIVSIIVLTFCWSFALADAPVLTMSDLLVKSGTEKQLEARPLAIKVGLRRNLARVPNPDEKTQQAFMRVEDAIDKAYDKDKVMGLLQQRVKDTFSPEELETMDTFLQSTLGKRLTEAENRLADEKAIENIIQNSTVIVKEINKDPERLKIIQSLMEAMGTTEEVVDDALDTSLAIEIALFNATPGRETPPMEVLEKNVEQQRFTIRGRVAQIILASSVSAYRSFSNAELQKYISFASTPVGKKYSRVISDALRKVNKQCAKDMGEIAAEATKRSDNS